MLVVGVILKLYVVVIGVGNWYLYGVSWKYIVCLSLRSPYKIEHMVRVRVSVVSVFSLGYNCCCEFKSSLVIGI